VHIVRLRQVGWNTFGLLEKSGADAQPCGDSRYVLAFSLGAGPVPALLLPEIFGARIRAKAVSLSLGVHWVSTNHSFSLKDESVDCTRCTRIWVQVLTRGWCCADLQLHDWAVFLERSPEVWREHRVPVLRGGVRSSSCVRE
jgi:hypothetical protein